MSSKDPSPDIPVSYLQEQQGLRLFELPSELCDIVVSGQHTSLVFKAPSETKTNGTDTSLSLAVLCTPDKTFEIKQVQTSNTVLIMRPRQIISDNGSAQITLEAFATCSSTIELHPFKATTKTLSAIEHLRNNLQVFASTSQTGPPNRMSKLDYFADVPFSGQECEQAWTDLRAFEHEAQGYRPAETLLIDLWRNIMKCVDVTSPSSLTNILTTLDADLPEYPENLKQVFVLNITKPGKNELEILFDKDKLIAWLNESHVSNIAKETGYADTDTILELWRSLTPDEWMDSRTQDLLFEMFNEKAAGGPKSASSSGAATGATGSVKRIGKATNWHEKLKRKRTT